MNRILRLRDGSSLDTLGIATIVVLLATLVLGALLVMPIYSLYKHPPAALTDARPAAKALDKFHDSMVNHVEMVNGRSWFFEPKPPAATVVTPKVPPKYSGPQLLAFINGTAWFADGQKVSASEPKSKSIELVRTNAPWSITVKWEGGEFDVDLFKRVDLLTLKDGSSFSSSYPAAAPTLGFGARPADATLPVLNGRPPSDRGDHPPEARIGPGVSPIPPATQGNGDAPPPPVRGPNDPSPPQPAAPGTPPATVPPSSPSPAPADPSKDPAQQPDPNRPSNP
jgi:hypothetical protein